MNGPSQRAEPEQDRESGCGAGRASGPPDADPLPCLFSNNCIEKLRVLGNHQKKTADLLRRSIGRMSQTHGIEKLGFFTLTFADHVHTPKEAQRRYHSLRSNVLKKRYLDLVRVIERQKSGRLHYHLVVALPFDIRTGYDFAAVKKGDYRSANAALRAEWAFWRKTAPRYRFGRTELQPIESNSAAISKYVGKYISKHIEKRLPEDKGMRLVEYSKGARDGTTNFAWISASSWLWREKARSWAASHGLENPEQVKAVFGKRWAWKQRKVILAFPLNYWPSMIHVMADHSGPDPVGVYIPADSTKITRFIEGQRQWQLESKCNLGWDSISTESEGTPGRKYRLRALPRISDEALIKKVMEHLPWSIQHLTAKERKAYKDRVNPGKRAALL